MVWVHATHLLLLEHQLAVQELVLDSIGTPVLSLVTEETLKSNPAAAQAVETSAALLTSVYASEA